MQPVPLIDADTRRSQAVQPAAVEPDHLPDAVGTEVQREGRHQARPDAAATGAVPARQGKVRHGILPEPCLDRLLHRPGPALDARPRRSCGLAPGDLHRCRHRPAARHDERVPGRRTAARSSAAAQAADRVPGDIDPGRRLQRAGIDRRYARVARAATVPGRVRGDRHRRWLEGCDRRDRRGQPVPVAAPAAPAAQHGQGGGAEPRPRRVTARLRRHARRGLVPLRRCPPAPGRALLQRPGDDQGCGRHHARAQFAEELGHARAGVGLLPRHRGHQACPVAVPGHHGRAGRVFDVRPGRARHGRRLERLRRRGHRAHLGHARQGLAGRSRRERLVLHERTRERSAADPPAQALEPRA